MQLTNGAITKSAALPPPAALASQLAAQELEGVDLETFDLSAFVISAMVKDKSLKVMTNDPGTPGFDS